MPPHFLVLILILLKLTKGDKSFPIGYLLKTGLQIDLSIHYFLIHIFGYNFIYVYHDLHIFVQIFTNIF